MSGLTTIEKRLIDDNSHCWVTINGRGYYVGKYYESKNKDKQCMQELLQAVFGRDMSFCLSFPSLWHMLPHSV
ncbi:hypothetical protein MKX03_002485 [Papaver bracteatum]|nr:hypothetical protein MKX03_002483 [Papaver bracteatum]KAI3860869.1 hypothetical protein MKX03_002485 [Papaver bracteatum]